MDSFFGYANTKKKKPAARKKRKYFRKCGHCGIRQEQSEMVRYDYVQGGWICVDCYQLIHPEEFIEQF